MQKKALADEPAGIVGEVYEKPRGSCGLEGSDSGDHIDLELFDIIILKGSYKQLLAINNTTVKIIEQLTTPVMPSGRTYETISIALLFTGDKVGWYWDGNPTAFDGESMAPLARSLVKDRRVSDVDLLSTPFVPALAAQLLAQLSRTLKRWEHP